MSNTTTHTRSIRYDRTTKDFAVSVDGELIGFAPSAIAGEEMANRHIDGLIAHEAQCQAAEQAAPVATAYVTSEAITATLEQARATLAADRRWLAALNKAAEKLTSTRWQFDGRRLLVASATTAGQRYMVERGMCECTAAHNGRVCWHVAAYGLLTRAARQQPATA